MYGHLKRSFQVTVNGETYLVDVEEKDNINTYSHPADTSPEQPPKKILRSQEAVSSRATHRIKAPIPGKVIEVKVKSGQKVSSGEVIIIIEAMKMENEISAPAQGIVREVTVQPGAVVTSGQLLAVIE